jgi:hypothetical protein
MSETYHSVLRYLCYIQVAQLLQLGDPPKDETLSAFLFMPLEGDHTFNYLNLLVVTTALLEFAGALNYVGEQLIMCLLSDFGARYRAKPKVDFDTFVSGLFQLGIRYLY